VKARIDRTVKRRLKKEFSKKIYSLPEARELQRLVQAKTENEVRNAVYLNIARKKVPETVSPHANDKKEGIYVKHGTKPPKGPKFLSAKQKAKEKADKLRQRMQRMEDQKKKKKTAKRKRILKDPQFPWAPPQVANTDWEKAKPDKEEKEETEPTQHTRTFSERKTKAKEAARRRIREIPVPVV